MDQIYYKFCNLFIGLSLTDNLSHQVGRNRKRSEQSINTDQNSQETAFSIVTDKWQSKTQFLMTFDPSSSIVLMYLIAAYSVYL